MSGVPMYFEDFRVGLEFHGEPRTVTAEDHETFMALAIEEAKAGAAMGEQPFGAVVVRHGEVVVKTRSLKVSTSDTTAHSETLAIKLATQGSSSATRMRSGPVGAAAR